LLTQNVIFYKKKLPHLIFTTKMYIINFKFFKKFRGVVSSQPKYQGSVPFSGL